TFPSRPEPERPLIIGVLSGSLKVHPEGWLTIAAFETLDRDMFSVVCLTQKTSEDWMARRFRALAWQWHEVDALDDAALAAKGRALDLDILIDLGGYGDGGR